MANGHDNLIPANMRSKEEASANGRKGGIKSGEVRRQRKAMRENLELLLSLDVKDKKMKSVMKALGLEDEELTNQMAMQVSMVREALKGNVQAYKEIRDTVGEKPQENVKLDGSINTTNPLEGLSTDEIRKAIEMMSNDSNK